MKMIPWLIIPVFILALYFALSRKLNPPEIKIEAPTIITESNHNAELEPISLSVFPTNIMQGEPALITIEGLVSASNINSLTLDGKPLAIFVDEKKIASIIGIDLHKTPGLHSIVLTLKDNRSVEEKIEIRERVMATTNFDIPDQLGGNTSDAEKKLLETLEQDTATLNKITGNISPEKLWSGQFQFPLNGSITVTDTYGYNRQTGSANISHNGTDFRAPEGTSVLAMNSGKVVFAESFRNYGKTVIVDHGLGVMTLYMHLSEINVKLGDNVEKGFPIAKSGNTGYSLGPHLHISVRIDGYSIDPLKFLELMGSS